MTTLQSHVLDVVERAVKTFVEVFLAVWGLSNFSMTKVVVYGAVAAGISAVVNTAAKVQQSTPSS